MARKLLCAHEAVESRSQIEIRSAGRVAARAHDHGADLVGAVYTCEADTVQSQGTEAAHTTVLRRREMEETSGTVH